jgi:hypothetical protein
MGEAVGNDGPAGLALERVVADGARGGHAFLDIGDPAQCDTFSGAI